MIVNSGSQSPQFCCLTPSASSTFSLATPATLCHILDAYIHSFLNSRHFLFSFVLFLLFLQTYLFSMPSNSTKLKAPGSSSHCKANSIPKVKPLTASHLAQSYVVIYVTLLSHIINNWSLFTTYTPLHWVHHTTFGGLYPPLLIPVRVHWTPLDSTGLWLIPNSTGTPLNFESHRSLVHFFILKHSRVHWKWAPDSSRISLDSV